MTCESTRCPCGAEKHIDHLICNACALHISKTTDRFDLDHWQDESFTVDARQRMSRRLLELARLRTARLNDTTAFNARLEDLERYRTQQRYAILAGHPETQDELIAIHYLSHARLAADMLEAIKMRKRLKSPELDDMIRHISQIIRENHRIELGIELAWHDRSV